MNCEHIFNIAISVDDETIQRNVIETATKTLENDILGCYFDNDLYPHRGRKIPSAKMQDIVERCVMKILDENKQLIIDEVVKNTTEKVARSKLVKEALQKTFDEEENKNDI